MQDFSAKAKHTSETIASLEERIREELISGSRAQGE